MIAHEGELYSIMKELFRKLNKHKRELYDQKTPKQEDIIIHD